jgi:hypothetical protein
VEAAPRYFPEGKEELAMDSEGIWLPPKRPPHSAVGRVLSPSQTAQAAVASAFRKSAEKAEAERRAYEEQGVWTGRELQALKSTALREVEAAAQVVAARAEVSHFRRQALFFQQQLIEAHRRAADFAAVAIQPAIRHRPLKCRR